MTDAPETPNLEGKLNDRMLNAMKTIVMASGAGEPQGVTPDLPSGESAAPKEPVGTVPEEQAGQGEDQAVRTETTEGQNGRDVPLRHLLEERAAKKAALSEKEALAKKVADLEARLTAKSTAEKTGDMELPADYAEWEPIKQQAWVAAWVMEQKLNTRLGKDGLQRIATFEVQSNLERSGVRVTQPQAESVDRVLREMPSLSATEALAVAKVRDAEVFASGANGAPPPSHMVSTPQSGPRNTSTKMTPDEVTKQMLATPTRGGREALARAFIAKNFTLPS